MKFQHPFEITKLLTGRILNLTEVFICEKEDAFKGLLLTIIAIISIKSANIGKVV